MVSPIPKPDSSYASNRLTRKNFNGKSLHSYLRGKGEEHQQDQAEKDPDIQAAPASSPANYSDEQEDEVPPGFEDFDSSPGERRRSRRGKKHKRDSESPTSSRKRTAEDIAYEAKREAEKEDWVFSQSQKKSRHGYLSKQRRDSQYSWKACSSNATSARLMSSPSSSAPESKVARNKQEVKEAADEASDSSEAPSKPGFIFPPSFHDTISSSSGITSSAQVLPIFDSDDDSFTTSLSSASETLLEEFSQMEEDFLSDKEDTEAAAPAPEPSLCPWCKKSVDAEALMRFKAQPKQRIREQQRFCESHQQTTAVREWKERGFPTIDWDNFEERIRGHFDDLDKILVPDSSSYYRNVLDTTLKAGKAKNFRLTLAGDALETICCGYYGTRGANKMLEAVTARFSRKLRRLAAEDHIVKQAGIVGYAQAVLVPELAVRLVKEDMGVNDDSARQILRESIDIGEKLNYALNDVVPVPVEDDTTVIDG